MKSKCPRGTARMHRRSAIIQFWEEQCRKRDKSQDHTLPGDAPDMRMPEYYIKHQKKPHGNA